MTSYPRRPLPSGEDAGAIALTRRNPIRMSPSKINLLTGADKNVFSQRRMTILSPAHHPERYPRGLSPRGESVEVTPQRRQILRIPSQINLLMGISLHTYPLYPNSLQGRRTSKSAIVLTQTQSHGTRRYGHATAKAVISVFTPHSANVIVRGIKNSRRHTL